MFTGLTERRLFQSLAERRNTQTTAHHRFTDKQKRILIILLNINMIRYAAHISSQRRRAETRTRACESDSKLVSFSHNAAKAACFQSVRLDSFRFNNTFSKKEIKYAYFGMPRALRCPICSDCCSDPLCLDFLPPPP